MGFRVPFILLWLLLLSLVWASCYWQEAVAPVQVPDTVAQVTASPEPILTPAEQKMKTAIWIATWYHDTHIYLGKKSGIPIDIFTCGDMATDVWDMFIAQGITAVIAVGNVNDTDSPYGYTHAWVMAEIEKDKWIAVDPTGGFLACSMPVCTVNNDLYYTGQFFITPNDFRNCAYPSWKPECRTTSTKDQYTG